MWHSNQNTVGIVHGVLVVTAVEHSWGRLDSYFLTSLEGATSLQREIALVANIFMVPERAPSLLKVCPIFLMDKVTLVTASNASCGYMQNNAVLLRPARFPFQHHFFKTQQADYLNYTPSASTPSLMNTTCRPEARQNHLRPPCRSEPRQLAFAELGESLLLPDEPLRLTLSDND